MEELGKTSSQSMHAVCQGTLKNSQQQMPGDKGQGKCTFTSNGYGDSKAHEAQKQDKQQMEKAHISLHIF